MNYIAEIKAFYDRLELNPQPNTVIALWHALMSIANRAEWPDTFTAAQSSLMLKSGLSASAFKRARNKLAMDGFIEWKSRGGSLSAQYKMKSLVVHYGLQSEPQNELQNEPQSGPQSDPINKHKQKQKQKHKTICAELDEPASTPPVITLILNDKAEYPIYQSDVNEWAELYPAVDVMQELRKMKGWCKDNPKRRKTKQGVRRFINSWLARQQDAGSAIRKQENNKECDAHGTQSWSTFEI